MPLTRQRIAMIIHALHGGGAERVTAQLASHWARQGHAVTLITLDSVASDHYPLDHEVRRVGLDLMGESRYRAQAVADNVRRLRRLRRAVRAIHPACVVSATDRINVMSLLACARLDVPVVIAEHSDPRHQPLPRAWEWLRGRSYHHAAVAVALTQGIADYMRNRWNMRATMVIPNGVALPEDWSYPPRDRRACTLLAMGRLSPSKGFDLLLEAFSMIAKDWPDWKLRILGEGPERGALESLIATYGLEERVELEGWVDAPHAALARAGLFVLSSRYEGFPVGLLEAMACGLPVVGFDCQSGPAEIIRNEVDGLLVPAGDVAALAAAMARLLGDPTLRVTLGRHAREVNERFSLQKCLARWDAVLERVIDKQQHAT